MKKLWSWSYILYRRLRFELRSVDCLSLAHLGVDEWLLIPWVGEIPPKLPNQKVLRNRNLRVKTLNKIPDVFGQTGNLQVFVQLQIAEIPRCARNYKQAPTSLCGLQLPREVHWSQTLQPTVGWQKIVGFITVPLGINVNDIPRVSLVDQYNHKIAMS